MVYNSRKAREIEIDGVKFSVKPLTVLQQSEYAEILKGEDGDKSHLKALYSGIEYLFNTVVENISGLKDYEGSDIDFASADKRELAEGLKIEDVIAITNAISEANALLETDKKKSSQPAESGTES